MYTIKSLKSDKSEWLSPLSPAHTQIWRPEEFTGCQRNQLCSPKISFVQSLVAKALILQFSLKLYDKLLKHYWMAGDIVFSSLTERYSWQKLKFKCNNYTQHQTSRAKKLL